MTLLNDFFSVITLDHSAGKISASLSLNAAHPIYAGHFPNNPIMPGVLMVQTVAEIMQLVFDRPLMLSNAANIKFLSVINPNETKTVEVSIDFSTTDSAYHVNAQLFAGALIFFKLKATLTSA